MAQPTRGPKNLKFAGAWSYVYAGKYIIRRFRRDAEWEVSDYGGNIISTATTLKEAVRKIEQIPYRSGGEG